jgi:hypothetical protein
LPTPPPSCSTARRQQTDDDNRDGDEQVHCIERLFNELGGFLEHTAELGASAGAACAARAMGCGVAEEEAAAQANGYVSSRSAIIRYDGSQVLVGEGVRASAAAAARAGKADLLVKIVGHYAACIDEQITAAGFGGFVATSFASVFEQQKLAAWRMGQCDDQTDRMGILAELRASELDAIAG